MKTSNSVWLALVLGLTALGCSSSDACEGAACAADGSGGGSGGPDVCTPWVPLNACLDDASCPAEPTLGVQAVQSIATRAEANPEILDFIPGSEERAVVVSSVANQVSELLFSETSLSFGREQVIDTGSDTSNMTSIKVDPTGAFAAVTVMEEDCVLGQVLFIDLGDDFGAVLGAVEVGYGPDSGDFSYDGAYFVTANEDDREDHPCKPADRQGGSISVIDLSTGPGGAAVVQTIPVDHALDSEPEGIAIAADGTVLVAVQETSELVRFSLGDVPDAASELIALTPGSEPDGLAISEDGKWAIIGYEAGDALAVLDMASGAVVSEYVIRNSGDVPDSYNRDESDTTHLHEPEGTVIFRSQGQLFVGTALQESHALITYRLSDSGELGFDSVAESGIGWPAEEDGREKSEVGPEGLAVHPGGMMLLANEREGSITLFRTTAAEAQICAEE
jgi:DNA-binding beta-propeller fold protein YncE